MAFDAMKGLQDVTLSGTVSDVSLAFGYLTLGGERIYFTDVYSVQLTGA